MTRRGDLGRVDGCGAFDLGALFIDVGLATVSFTCSALDTDAIFGDVTLVGDQVMDDPLFCEPVACTSAPTTAGAYTISDTSPCMPANNTCGVLIGALVVLVRVGNPTHPDGVVLAILMGNVCAPLIDHFVVRANVRRRARRLTPREA